VTTSFKRYLTILIVFFSASILLSGCVYSVHEGPTYGEQVVDGAGLRKFKLDAVAILDDELQVWEYIDYNDSNKHSTKSKISVVNLGKTKLSTNNYEVFTTITNRTDYPISLSIRTQFYDKNNVSIENPSQWQKLFLSQNSVLTYKEKSLSNNVEHFLIEIKQSN